MLLVPKVSGLEPRTRSKWRFFSLNATHKRQTTLQLPEIDPGASFFLLAGELFSMSNHWLIELLDPKIGGLEPGVLRTRSICIFSFNNSHKDESILRLPEIDLTASFFLLAAGLFLMFNHRLIALLISKIGDQ